MKKQTPIYSSFEASTKSSDIIHNCDIRGKIAIVTGGYSGIGLETVRALHYAGAEIIVPARNQNKALVALKGLDRVKTETMDLLDPSSIDAFAQRFLASDLPLHLLVNNAGIMACPLARDNRGYESQFATNHLGHFQLTLQLWPALLRAKGARVISVSSWAHRHSPVLFDDPNFKARKYDRWIAYGQSKTANILFSLELDTRGKAAGIRSFSLHPGTIISTELSRHLSNTELQRAGFIDKNGKPIIDPSKGLKTIEQGAATILWCSTTQQLEGIGGVYCQDCDIAPIVDNKVNKIGSLPLGVMPYAVNPESADRLWSLSEQLVGSTFS